MPVGWVILGLLMGIAMGLKRGLWRGDKMVLKLVLVMRVKIRVMLLRSRMSGLGTSEAKAPSRDQLEIQPPCVLKIGLIFSSFISPSSINRWPS